MRIGTARCPKCEAKIDVDINSDTTICEKCGQAIDVKEAIEKQFEDKYKKEDIKDIFTITGKIFLAIFKWLGWILLIIGACLWGFLSGISKDKK